MSEHSRPTFASRRSRTDQSDSVASIARDTIVTIVFGDETQGAVGKKHRGEERTPVTCLPPVTDQNVIVKIKESVTGDARDATWLDIYLCIYVLQWMTARERGDFEGVTR